MLICLFIFMRVEYYETNSMHPYSIHPLTKKKFNKIKENKNPNPNPRIYIFMSQQ